MFMGPLLLNILSFLEEIINLIIRLINHLYNLLFESITQWTNDSEKFEISLENK